MNTTETIAATYLRLNGFLLLPLFTLFEQEGARHVDLVGLRAQGSMEQSLDRKGNLLDLPTDEKLFAAFEKAVPSPKNALLGVVGEIEILAILFWSIAGCSLRLSFLARLK